MRTVAALTMIMAIVVAAIPVENLDIVRADYANTLTINYASDVAGANNNSDLYTANSYENSYGGDQLRIQRIEGSMITELFTVQKSGTNADTAMITGSLLASGTNSLDIRNEEYYQYIQFDNTFVSPFRAAVGSLAYTYTYQATPQTFNGGTDSTGNNVSGSITINILSTASPTGNSNNAGTGSITATTDDGGYTSYNLSNLTADTVYTSSYTSNIRTAQENLIRTYNTMAQQDIATLQAIQNKVSSSGNGSGKLTDTDRNNWANLQAKYASGQGASDYSAARTLNVSFSNLGGTGTASLTNFEKDLICKCFYNSSNNSLTLDRYELIEISKGQSSVYVPRLTGSNAALTGQSVDTNKYLVSGRARIDGIKSNAFVGAGINTLNIASNIRFIGAEAFAGSPLRTVTIDMTNCEIIGDRAFKGCTNLTNVSFTGTYTGTASKLQEIGKEAFADTALSAITIPNSVGTIGAGGFANNAQLSRVEFASGGTNTAMTMQPYAFFNATNLSSVVFPSGTNNRQFQIMKFGFALDTGTNGGSLSDFTFPAANNSVNYGSEADYDYILANRSRLQTVTWPGLLQNKIPDNTLWGCEELSYTRFPDGAARADYTADALFQGVQNTDFYVEGPANINAQTVATPRKTTWTAKAGYDNGNGIIPYKFTDSTGTHFEIGVKENPADTEPKYIATIDVTNEAAKEATLSKYTAYTTPNANDRFSIVIPDKVGEYTVVAIGPNCFDDDIKNKIYELIIKDGSVRQIAAEAFKGSENLQWVEIGDAVASIGREAFADCPKLENVVFSQTQTAGFYGQDAYWKDQHVLGTDAFKTGSTYLTFHGAIHPDYAPFALAMSADSKNMTSTRSECQICYKTDAPLNLTVIRDADGKATLIDYPHYEEVDYINEGLIDEYKTETNDPDFSIKDRFELVNEIGNNTNDDNKAVPTWARDIVLQTLNMNLPKGIENIDSAKYFKDSKNSADFVYFNRIYKKNDPPYSTTNPPYEEDTQPRYVNTFGKAGNESVNSLYSSYQYTPNDAPDDYVETVPGLFSGFFDESDLDKPDTNNGNLMWNAYDGHSYTENNERGNDYLTSVQMPTVEEFPDYAFDSAENLKSLTIGSALDKVGIQPFRDCKSLFEINTGDSTKYAYDGNMLFYENEGDSTQPSYKIIQCLEGRGRRDAADGNYGSTEISSKTNPWLSQVSSIADYAFANCEEIYTVDLSDTSVRTISEGAFNGCSKLESVTLPATVNMVQRDAFVGVTDRNFRLEVPNPNCYINPEAFDLGPGRTETLYISGIQYVDEKTEETSTCYNAYLELLKKYPGQVEFNEIGTTYTVRFYDEDRNQLGSNYEIARGEDVLNPPIEAARAAAKTGRRFDTWLCLLDNGEILRGEEAYKNVTENRRVEAIYVDDPSSVVPDGNNYTLTVQNGTALVNNNPVTIPATVHGGDTITIIATDSANFRVWTVTPNNYTSLLLGANNPVTTFTMPNANITVTANSAIDGSGANPDGTYTVTVNNGTGGGNYRPGATVTITANTPNTGASFVNWTTTTSGVTFANATSASTTFVMPSSNVSVTANFSDGTGGQPGGNTPGGDNTTKYKVTVNYGSGSGEYAAGETVNITANAPESSNRVFSRWTTSNSGLGFANANAVSTSFVMPATDVTVTANYKTRTSDDDDDDDDDSSSSRRPGTNTSTNTVTNTPGSSTNTTGTTGTVNNPSNESGSTAGTNNTNGNRIYITKNGISNTDVASLAVSGSTDNFIVRITESAEATAAVEQALTNTYGSLSGLAYLPMDISLYDSTGQNKITDTTGLNITVTMPIPDVLIQYGGNARVAAADNGNLVQLTPRFTTIDGIACISFVPPHFSPYVIYVDTNNLIAGQMLDSTPATGDPIHPKWFAAIGMACVSILLFVTSDGRKRKKFRAA